MCLKIVSVLLIWYWKTRNHNTQIERISSHSNVVSWHRPKGYIHTPHHNKKMNNVRTTKGGGCRSPLVFNYMPYWKSCDRWGRANIRSRICLWYPGMDKHRVSIEFSEYIFSVSSMEIMFFLNNYAGIIFWGSLTNQKLWYLRIRVVGGFRLPFSILFGNSNTFVFSPFGFLP